MLSQTPPGAENGSQRTAFGSLWGDFWVPDCIIRTLLKQRYLLQFQAEIEFWARTDSVRNAGICQLLCMAGNLTSFFAFLYPT